MFQTRVDRSRSNEVPQNIRNLKICPRLFWTKMTIRTTRALFRDQTHRFVKISFLNISYILRNGSRVWVSWGCRSTFLRSGYRRKSYCFCPTYYQSERATKCVYKSGGHVEYDLTHVSLKPCMKTNSTQGFPTPTDWLFQQ